MSLDDWPTTTQDEVHEAAQRLFLSQTSTSSGKKVEQDEVTATTELSIIKSEISKIRKDVETILSLLHNSKQSDSDRVHLRETKYNLEEFIGMWSDLTPEEDEILKESFSKQIRFNDDPLGLSKV